MKMPSLYFPRAVIRASYMYVHNFKLSLMFCEIHYLETNTGRESLISLYSDKRYLKKLPNIHKQQIQYTLKR